jgi:hypothetical protein
MSVWLREGQFASHVIDFSCHGLSPFWNGHWAYSDHAWRVARGRREVFLNHEPIIAHVDCANKSGFEMLLLKTDCRTDGLDSAELSPRFRPLDPEDLRTRGAKLILRKRRDG